ncbi:MAG: OsmC family protein [Acholeplasmataceae bacterium]
MKTDNITLSFQQGFKGTLESPTSKINIGDNENGIQPYHMLYGALGSCFYATFLSVSEKMRLTFSKATVEISGEKRDETPATLKHVKVELTIYQPSHQEKLIKAAQNGAKFCSIYTTVSQVAEMELVVLFKEEV